MHMYRYTILFHSRYTVAMHTGILLLYLGLLPLSLAYGKTYSLISSTIGFVIITQLDAEIMGYVLIIRIKHSFADLSKCRMFELLLLTVRFSMVLASQLKNI